MGGWVGDGLAHRHMRRSSCIRAQLPRGDMDRARLDDRLTHWRGRLVVLRLLIQWLLLVWLWVLRLLILRLLLVRLWVLRLLILRLWVLRLLVLRLWVLRLLILCGDADDVGDKC